MSEVSPTKRIIKQYAGLLSSTLLMIGLQFGVSSILTHALTAVDFAIYRKVLDYSLLLQSIFTSGIPVTLSYLIANDDARRDEYNTFGLRSAWLSVGVATLLSYALLLIQLNTGLSIVNNTALLFSPLCAVAILVYYVEYLCIGSNRIKVLSMQRATSPIILIVLLLLLWCLMKHVPVTVAILVYGVTNLAVIGHNFYRLGLTRRISPEAISAIRENNKTLGLQTYIGSLFSVISTRLFLVLVGMFVADAQYGPYSLMVSISAPLGPFMTTLGSVMYKRFRDQERIGKKMILIIVLIAVFAAIAFSIGMILFVPIIFGKAYAGSISYAIVLGLGSVCVGTGDIFNRYIMSKGQGKYIRNCAIATGMVNIVLGALLISSYNIWGITIARVASNVTYLVLMVFLYRRTVRKGLSAASLAQQ